MRKELIASLTPTHSGWFAQADIAAMDITANRPSMSARRFEAGTPAVMNCYAAEAGLKIILEAGKEPIERRVRGLTDLLLQRLMEIGWPSVTPRAAERHGPMVCVRARSVGHLVDQLLQQDIVTSFRDDNLRATLHFYNDEQDVEIFIDALERQRRQHSPEPR